MKKYLIRINCPAYDDIEVEAETEKEAIEEAIAVFDCPGGSAEFCEILAVGEKAIKNQRGY